MQPVNTFESITPPPPENYYRSTDATGLSKNKSSTGEILYYKALHYQQMSNTRSYGLHLLHQAAFLGCPIAQSDLGFLYVDGLVVEQNVAFGLRYLRLADRNHCSEASMHLGAMYELGQGVPVNLSKAITYYKRALGSDISDVALDIQRVGVKMILSGQFSSKR